MVATRPSLDLWDPRNPKIIWDGLGLMNSHSGIGFHARMLYKALVSQGVCPLVTRLHQDLGDSFEAASGLQIIENAPGPEVCRKCLSFFARLKVVFPNLSYRAAQKLKTPLIYHGLSNLNLPTAVARRTDDRFVVTVHDVIPLLVGEVTWLSLQMQWLMPRVLERADAIITISNWTRDTVAELFGSQLLKKITVIPNGFSNETIQADESLADGFVLTVARGECYKRLHLISAMATARPQYQFHIVTDHGGVRRLGRLPPNVKIHVGISDDALAGLYSKASIMVHPSLYEGWCLPAARALSQSLNLVYCGGSGIDEVCQFFPGQSAALSKKAPISAWVDAIDMLLGRRHGSGHDEDHQGRTSHQSSQRPDWQFVASETLKVYQNLL
jgi:glycosyltransferase involved in cell wall biosynthesis